MQGCGEGKNGTHYANFRIPITNPCKVADFIEEAGKSPTANVIFQKDLAEVCNQTISSLSSTDVENVCKGDHILWT